MRKNLETIIVFAIAALMFVATIASATYLFPYQGGLGTNLVPSSGSVPIGTGSSTYTPAFLTGTGLVTIVNTSGTVSINVSSSASGISNLFVSPTSSVLLNNFFFYTAAGSSTVSATSSLSAYGLALNDSSSLIVQGTSTLIGATLVGSTLNASGTISQNGTGVVLTTRSIGTTSPLGGGGALSGDLTLTCTTCVTGVSASNRLFVFGTTAPTLSLASSTANGDLLIGSGSVGSWNIAGLTGTASQIAVVNGSGTITLQAAQNIASTSTVTFGSSTISAAFSAATINASTSLNSVSSTLLTQLTIPNFGTGNNALGVNGQLSIMNVTNTLHFFASSTEMVLNPELCTTPFEVQNTTSGIVNYIVFQPKMTSTITQVAGINNNASGTMSFNLLIPNSNATSSASASSSFSHVFNGVGIDGDVTSTAVTYATPNLFPNLVSFSSTTVPANSAVLLTNDSVASTTDWAVTICYKFAL